MPLNLMRKLGPQTTTERGFPLVQFEDEYGKPCQLQASSLALYEEPGTSAVWLGLEGAEPIVLARQAHLAGVKTAEMTGWVPFPIPSEVSLHTRMHLNREQVEALINHLQSWLVTGQFKLETE